MNTWPMNLPLLLRVVHALQSLQETIRRINGVTGRRGSGSRKVLSTEATSPRRSKPLSTKMQRRLGADRL